jgi:protocatechuate 3,4-dioxygenase beta subunit
VNATAPAAVTGTASSSTAVATIAKTLVTADLRVDSKQTTTTIGYGATATQTITGTVTDATGSVVPGATVNISGAGLAFVADTRKVFTVGSAVVNADANGAYSIDVYSTTAGKTSVVVTSGAATKSVAIEFSGVTALLETNVVSIDVASLSQVGRSVTATVKVVDKFANPVSGVAVAVSVTGVGSLSAATVTTGTAGTATVQFVAGANDFGDAVITAKYTATDAAATVVSASKTLTVGMTDAQIDIVGKRVTAVASFSKGKTVAFYVDGIKKWSKLSASDADVVLNYNLKKGTHTITVKISGGLTTTERFIVK